MNKKTVYLLFTVLLVAFAACKEDSTVFYSLNKTDLAIHPKETFQFAVWEQSMDFNRVYAGSITWSVIDQVPIEPAHTEVARIDETGLLTAVNPGQAIVKAACANGYTVMSAITVNAWDAPDASGLVLDRYDIYQNPAQTYTDTLTLSVSDDILSKFDLVVTSSDTTLITPILLAPTEEDLAAGNKDYHIVLQRTNDITTEKDVEITVSAGETSVTCVVHISMRLYLSFSPVDLSLTDNPDLVKENSYRIKLNEIDTVKAYYRLQPDDAAHLEKMEDAFTYTTSGSSALIIEKTEFVRDSSQLWIVVRAGSLEGSTDITIEALGNKIVASCSVVDINNTIVNSVTFDMDGIKAMIGEDLVTSERGFSLFDYLSVDPLTATVDWPVEWTSSKEEVATVITDGNDAGAFTIWKAGVFTITATCRDKSASVTITAKLRLENIAFVNNLKTELAETETTQWAVNLSAKSNYKTDDVVVTWTSSDEKVATVAPDGTITAVGAGKATITASVTDDYGKTLTAEKEITVISAADIEIEDLTFDADNYSCIVDGNTILVGDNAGTVTYEFHFQTDGTTLNFDTPGVLTFGTDFMAGSQVIYPNQENPNITAGMVEVLDTGNFKFDLKAQKGGKEVSITGEVQKL